MAEFIVKIEENDVPEQFMNEMKNKHTELIRCKDCKYYDNAMMSHYGCIILNGKRYGMTNHEDDDFCSYGKKDDK
mgnify:CR=1 FL=1